jgi:anti-sigma factor RsiW
MHEAMRKLLNAYLDGELHGKALREMELHLDVCVSCQKELEELRRVSELLRAAPVPEFIPADDFVSNLILRLPRNTQRDLPAKNRSWTWWLVPAGLLGVWFFTQTVFLLSSVLSVAQTTGLIGQAGNRLGGDQVTIWFAAVTGLFGGQASWAQPALSFLNEMSVSGTGLLEGFLWKALIVFLFWAWLIFWWFWHPPQPMELGSSSK